MVKLKIHTIIEFENFDALNNYLANSVTPTPSQQELDDLANNMITEYVEIEDEPLTTRRINITEGQ